MRLGEHSKWVDRISKGVMEMKIGTNLFLIVVIMIAFGYGISDDLQLREDRAQLLEEFDQNKQELEQLSNELNTCTGNVLELQKVITELEAVVRELSDKKLEYENTIATLQARIAELETHIQEQEDAKDLLQQTIADLQNQVQGEKDQVVFLETTIAELNAAIREKETVISSQQDTMNQLYRQINITEAQKVAAKVADSSDPAEGEPATVDNLVIALIIINVSLVIVLLAQYVPMILRARKSKVNTEYVKLSPIERSLIINHRRSKRA